MSAQLFHLAPTPSLTDVTEKQLTGQVVEITKTLGWLRYHTWRSKHSPSGYPDETLVRDRVIFLELKTETGRTTEQQRQWLRALLKADAETYLIRPRNLQQLAHILAARRDQLGGHLTTEAARAAETELHHELRRELDR